jgi:hypothetical protein
MKQNLTKIWTYVIIATIVTIYGMWFYSLVYEQALKDVAEDFCLKSGAVEYIVTDGDIYCIFNKDVNVVKLN